MRFKFISATILFCLNCNLYPQEIKIITDQKADKQISESFQEMFKELSKSQDSVYVLKNWPNTICIPDEKNYTFISVKNNMKIDNIFYEFNKFTLKDELRNSNEIDKLYDAYSDLSFQFFRSGIQLENFNDELPKKQNGFEFLKVENILIKDLEGLKKILQKK